MLPALVLFLQPVHKRLEVIQHGPGGEAQAAGKEGEVIVQAFITDDGKTSAVKVLKNETGSSSLDEAAMAAIRQVTWEPAKQKDKPVGVWISIPVNFKLNDGEK